jgi:serine/threonine-protein kinase
VTTTPERLGKYPVIGVLGKGAMGVVYRAVDPVIKRAVAIKTVRRELFEDDTRAEAVARRFRLEAQAAGALNHSGIVAIYEYGEDDQYAYIAMEYVEGNSLRDYLGRGVRFDENDTISIIAQLLDALEYAHYNSVWHRDIKPANIIITNEGRVKLADFGIARIDTGDLTHTNVLVGTPGYVAPEHYLGLPVDHRADIFSAGAVFYQLLAGHAPFRGTPEAIMHSVCYGEIGPASQNDPAHRWPQYDASAARALMKRPDDRFPSAGAFRAAVVSAYGRAISDTLSRAAVITEPLRPTSSGHASSGSLPKGGPPSLPSMPTPTGWDAAALAPLERELARFIGPVARVLVRRTAREHTTLDALAAALSESLSTPEEAKAFLSAIGKAGVVPAPASRAPGAVSSPASIPMGPQPSAEEVERATRLLIARIGPIAKVVVKRAVDAKLARREFVTKIAEAIDSDADRDRFVRDVGL